MRPAGRGEFDSLYFDYPHFDPPEGAARTRLTAPARVAIVGAGPVGMASALALAREGVSSVIFDAKPTLNDGSRAICLARETFYLLRRIGVLPAFEAKSLPWTTGWSYYRGQQILEFRMHDSEEELFRPMYNLEQQYTEQFLWEAVHESPLIDTRWQSEVVGLQDVDGGVELSITDPIETYTLRADWVLAADGAHSPMRRLRGLRLQGENYEGRYVIADVQMAFDHPTVRLALFDPACRPGGTVLVHKQPDNIWRIDYQLTEGKSEEEALKEENVSAAVASVIEEIGYTGEWKLEWWSIYSANTLALDDYRDGRIFFVGDSAHIVPIFGVRGLNNGIADALNIGWKLGWLLNGKAGEEILDSYTPERRGATLDVFDNAKKSTRFMTPPTPGFLLMRDAALSLALDYPFAGDLANPRNMTPYTYAESPLVENDDTAFDGGPAPGEVLPECRLDDGYLSDHLAPWFNIFCFNPALAGEIKLAFQDISDRDIQISVLDFPSKEAAHLGAGENSAYLIRPDRYIAARWKSAAAQDIRVAFNNIICRR